MGDDRDGKPHFHAGAVRADRALDRRFKLSEFNDRVETLRCLPPSQSTHDRYGKSILAPS
jgi:hypothetical protein